LPKFLPKTVPDESWQQLTGNKAYAFRCTKDDFICLRFGQGHGVYTMVVADNGDGRVVNTIDFETGQPTLSGKIPAHVSTCIGRTGECGIKIMHAIVSRQHLSLRLEGPILLVKDLGSTNGTYCHKENTFLDIDNYLESHPLNKVEESTLDAIHELFGPTLDDFLKNYSKQKETPQ
jgi:hypothetical protein